MFAPIQFRLAQAGFEGSQDLPVWEFDQNRKPIEIREARSRFERASVYRFRYSVYVEEMKRDCRADHEGRRIIDAVDDKSVTFMATHDDRVVGTVRCSFSAEVALDYADLYRFDRFGKSASGILFAAKLMVDPAYRKTHVFSALVQMTYLASLTRGVDFIVIDCNDHLVKTFRRLGFIPYQEKAVHPEFGLVNFMALEVKNLEHLESVRSPFANILKTYFSKAAHQPETKEEPNERV